MGQFYDADSISAWAWGSGQVWFDVGWFMVGFIGVHPVLLTGRQNSVALPPSILFSFALFLKRKKE